MHIAQIVERLEIGGLERMAVDLAIAEKAAGHKASIYCVTYDGPLGKTAEAAGIRVVPFFKERGFSAGAVWQIGRRLRADHVDVVHTHNSVIHHYGAAAALLAGAPPVVNTEHGLGALHMNERGLRIFRATIPFTRTVVFVAEEPKRALWDRYGFPPSKARVIRNGIPLQRFRARPATPGAAAPRFRFGTVGRMAPVKDHATLVRAFARAAESLPGSELHILGYGELEEETRQLASDLRLGKAFQIHHGNSDVPAFLSSLDVFVLSSRSEALPVCVLEAMACGLPIVSTRVGGVPEVALENQVAWYCPPEDPEALAEALKTATCSGELASRGRRGAEIVEDYGIEETARRYCALFRELLG